MCFELRAMSQADRLYSGFVTSYVTSEQRISPVFSYVIYIISGASLVTQMVQNLPAMQVTWVQFLGQEDPFREGNGYPL